MRFINVLTSEIRLLPDFILIGGQKCGTTSLYNYMKQHPYFIPTFVPEVHFFDNHFYKGINWYKSFFPSKVYQNFFKMIYGTEFTIGEKSPLYIFHPHALGRISKTIKDVKLILLLRNPVERAYSHYHHEVRYNREPLSFKEAIKKEVKRLEGELQKLLRDKKYVSFKYSTYSYLKRGIYIDQVKRLYRYFSEDEIMIIKSENFFQNPQRIVNRVFRFLGLPKFKIEVSKIYLKGDYPQMSQEVKKDLYAFFKPYNEKLYKFLGRDFNWEREIGHI